MVAIKMYYPYFFLPLIVIYLLFNIFDGNNGLLSHARLDNEIVKLEQEVNKIKSSNNLYEIKITSLQNQNESLDLLDEQIRNVLGYGKNNEFIIFFDN
jgi:cell division protein FtsB